MDSVSSADPAVVGDAWHWLNILLKLHLDYVDSQNILFTQDFTGRHRRLVPLNGTFE